MTDMNMTDMKMIDFIILKIMNIFYNYGIYVFIEINDKNLFVFASNSIKINIQYYKSYMLSNDPPLLRIYSQCLVLINYKRTLFQKIQI